MKKKISYMIILCLAIITLASCGKKYGYEDLFDEMKNGTYATPTDANEDGWVIENIDIKDAEQSVKNIVNQISGFKTEIYIGYKVEDNKIVYAFTGIDNFEEQLLIYVRQTEKNIFSLETYDYEKVKDILK